MLEKGEYLNPSSIIKESRTAHGPTDGDGDIPVASEVNILSWLNADVLPEMAIPLGGLWDSVIAEEVLEPPAASLPTQTAQESITPASPSPSLADNSPQLWRNSCGNLFLAFMFCFVLTSEIARG